MPRPIIFGEIEGIEEGRWFEGHKEMMNSSFHRNWAAGIDGNGREGTAAIVLSGGYEDDVDLGDEIIYTGAGGNDSNTGKQIEDQSWTTPGNAGLLKSWNEGLPVRIIRGHKHKSKYSPESGYTYGGLYSVIEAWEEIGKSGYKICRFRLVYSGQQNDQHSPNQLELKFTPKEKRRSEGTILRIIRDSRLAHYIKELYEYKCQVCEVSIATKAGRYAEGAHIKPLGMPHDGEDVPENLLCLCPNHHVMFDRGGFSIADDFSLLGQEEGNLIIHPDHIIDKDNIAYHRGCHGYD